MKNRNTLSEYADYLTRRIAQILCAFLLAAVALGILPKAAHAQIIGDVEITVPFSFHVGDAKLPPGTYRIHVLDDTNSSMMEIIKTDDSVSASFDVQNVQANSTPAKSEAIFDKYGKRYFLSKLFDEGESNGSEIVKSRYEKRLISAQEAAEVVQQHVPARKPKA